jgi:hypothetical protein
MGTNWLNKIVSATILANTPSCQEVAARLSQSLGSPLPLGMRLWIRLHCAVYLGCERYRRQLKLLRQTSRRFSEHADQAVGEQLPTPARERFRQSLKRVIIENRV